MPNVEERGRSVLVALYCCKGAIGKWWEFSLAALGFRSCSLTNTRECKIFYILCQYYSMMYLSDGGSSVKPYSLYAGTCQRAALIGICGALSIIPTLALYAILQ